jgi:hypothetical protein
MIIARSNAHHHFTNCTPFARLPLQVSPFVCLRRAALRYCRCRGVPVPMFEGETDDNNKGIPLSQTEAGYWPWWPNLYTSYYSNTDPPRK